MFSIFTLISCQPLLEAKTPPPPDSKPQEMGTPKAVDAPIAEVRMPSGQAIVRECYASADRERRSSSRYSPPPAAPKSAPMPTTTATPAASAPMGVGGAATGSSSYGAPSTADGTATTASRASRDEGGLSKSSEQGAGPMKKAENKPSKGYDAPPAPPADAVAAAEPMTEEAEAPREKGKSDKDVGNRGESRTQPDTRTNYDPNLDWGATVYLSNDDSMSLASAQRLLWAVQNRGPVQSSQIRPHELLNYFSFDTDPVSNGSTFSARGSAEVTAPGVMTFAFAVKGVNPPREPLDLTLVDRKSVV